VNFGVVDLGYLGKVRPVLVISVPFLDTDRPLVIVVPHTTTLIGSRFENSIPHPALQEGAFDVQQITAIPAAKFIRRLGVLPTQHLQTIENGIGTLLGLRLARQISQ
jgi:mRNA interferase MazF